MNCLQRVVRVLKPAVLFQLVLLLLMFTPLISVANPPFSKKLLPVTVLLDWFPNPDQALLFVAEEQGFFKSQGLDVKLIGPADPADPPKLVAAGRADIAITYQPSLLLQIEKGLPLTRIATLIGTPLDCLAVRADGPIHTIADLKGKRIGYSNTGIDHVMIATMLKSSGLSIQDVEMINVHYDLTQALLAKKIDAATGVMRNFELLQMRLAGTKPRAFYPEEFAIPPYDELILVVNKERVHDPRWPAFIRAMNLGVQYLVNHPEESWLQFAKDHPEINNPLNHQAWFATLPRFSLSPAALDHSRYNNFARFMQSQGLIKTVPPLKDYTTEIAY